MRRATAGEAAHSAANGSATGHEFVAERQSDNRSDGADNDRRRHSARQAQEVKAGTERRLRRRNPFE